MASSCNGSGTSKLAHVLCMPFPAQGHLNPMMQMAKLLHHKGFYITYVNTEYNHKRLLKSQGAAALAGIPGFQFKTIPDGLPPSDEEDVTQSIPLICDAVNRTALEPFKDLVRSLDEESRLSGAGEVLPVTRIICDGALSFTLRAAQELGIPAVSFWTPSACGFLAYCYYRLLKERGLVPLRDDSDLTNGYLETTVEDLPGFKNMRLKDIPSFIRTTDPNDFMFNFIQRETAATDKMAAAVILNTFDSLEQDVLSALSSTLQPRIYSIGPLPLLVDYMIDDDPVLKSFRSNLWAEEPTCLEWLDKHESVVYVNFGSITVMTPEQLTEFAWGLANSKKPFLWIIRPDLVAGGSSLVLPREFVDETKDRGMLASWCPQVQVLKHRATRVFLTHSGWNSTIETIIGGVPVISWPFFAEQQTNCHYSCAEWEIGMEIDNNVKRDEVEKLVREMVDGEKGKELKKRAMEWKARAEAAAEQGGSSSKNLEKFINQVLLS
ncbi:hypothetical protein Dimus_010467 [Dionaea muscipula]